MAILLSTSRATSATSSFSHHHKKLSYYSSILESSNPNFTCLINENFTRFRHKDLHLTLCVKGTSCSPSPNQTIETKKGKLPRKGNWKPLLSEGRDEDEDYGLICPGCGVFMQDNDPTLPGFYQQRKVKEPEILDFVDQENGIEDYIEGELEEIEGELEEIDGEDDNSKIDGEDDNLRNDGQDANLKSDDEFFWDSDGPEFEFDDGAVNFDGFTPPGVGYGNVTEQTLERENQRRPRLSKAERKRLAKEAAKEEKEEVTVCARCHSLRNYGKVKNQTAENLIPDFDFDRLISTRLVKPTGNADSTVVVMVVDCVDFDGSFPKRAAQSLFKFLGGSKDRFSKKLPKLVLVATKVDLLPSQISPTRLDRWVRHRAKALGAPRLSGVYLVSSKKDLGVRNLLSFIKDLAGPRGHVWVIGAQNAGKSTLINAFAKKGGVKATKLTEAAVPGTTLGILRVAGVLSAKAKMYDTPGLLHPYLMSIRLNREEQKMVEIRKELRPRSFRIKQGQTVRVGGLMRLDLNDATVETIYVTVWVSPFVSLHMGKTETADDIWSKHAGIRLQPPVGEDRVAELGQWKAREIKVSGRSWDVNSVDISAAGLGWFSLGLKGEAFLTLWTLEGVEITLREPLVFDRARTLERPGFLLPKAISDGLSKRSKADFLKREEEEEEEEEESEVALA